MIYDYLASCTDHDMMMLFLYGIALVAAGIVTIMMHGTWTWTMPLILLEVK